MDDLGQAEVNAEIVGKMVEDFLLPKGSKILMPGCGTGQIFDYLSPNLFKEYEMVFTDINLEFLEKLSGRLSDTPIGHFRCHVDDLESTHLDEEFDGIIPVLVLEQLDWNKALKTLIEYKPQYIYLIIQEQWDGVETITVNVKSRESILKFSEMANPQLVPRDRLIKCLSESHYHLSKTYEREVPNSKRMVGLVFRRDHDRV